MPHGDIAELSLVEVPAAEPSEKAVPLFQTGKYQTEGMVSASFQFKEATKLDHGGLWLTYINF